MNVALLRITLATLFVIASFQTSRAQMPSGGPWVGKLDDLCKEWGNTLKSADKSDAALKTTIDAANRKMLQQLSGVDIPFSDENLIGGGVAKRIERCLAREANDPHVLGGARQATTVTAKTLPMSAENDPNSGKQSIRPGGTRDFFRIDPRDSIITVSLGASVVRERQHPPPQDREHRPPRERKCPPLLLCKRSVNSGAIIASPKDHLAARRRRDSRVTASIVRAMTPANSQQRSARRCWRAIRSSLSVKRRRTIPLVTAPHARSALKTTSSAMMRHSESRVEPTALA